VPSNEILTATDDVLLISRLGLTEEVDSRDPTRPGKGIYFGGFSSKVVEKENKSEEEECQQSERISGVMP